MRFYVPVLSLLGCAAPLEGDLTVDFDPATRLLTARFQAASDYRAGTAFVSFAASNAALGPDEETKVCQGLTSNDVIQIAVPRYAADAFVHVEIKHDDPRLDPNRDPKAPLRDPERCGGNLVAVAHWTNDGPAFPEEVEDPTEDPIEDPTKDPEDTAGALAAVAPIKVCDSLTATIDLENVGDGDLAIHEASLLDGDGQVVMDTDMKIPAGASRTIEVDFDAAFELAHVLLLTDDPDKPYTLVKIHGAVPRIALNPRSMTFTEAIDVADFTITNDGCGELGEIVAEVSTDAFRLGACGNPCTYSGPQSITVIYEPSSDAVADFANIRLSRAADPTNALDMPISGSTRPCVAPTVEDIVVAGTEGEICAGQPVRLQPQTRGELGHFDWLLLGPGRPQVVEGEDGAATFLPLRVGQYQVGLSVAADCGARAEIYDVTVDVTDVCK